jgi:hypothetical protein
LASLVIVLAKRFKPSQRGVIPHTKDNGPDQARTI